MKIRRRIVRNRFDTDGIWGDLVLTDRLDVEREFSRSISRRIFISTVLAFVLILSSLGFWVYSLDGAQANVPSVVAHAKDSLVDVWCGNSGGTGVAIEMPIPDQYKTGILSAAHVFEECKKNETIKVIYEGRDYRGYLAGKDPEGKIGDLSKQTDLALIYVKFAMPALAPAPEAHVGDWAIVMGDPYDHINYASFGIVTDVQKDQYGTDAATNHGNSGGPLLDSAGRVLGIMSYGELHEDQFEGNPKGIIDQVAGITYAKRLRLSCDVVFNGAAGCPFSE